MKAFMYNLFCWHSAARRFFHNHSIRIYHGGWQGLSKWTTDKPSLLRPGQESFKIPLAFFWFLTFCNFLTLYSIHTRWIYQMNDHQSMAKTRGTQTHITFNYVPVLRKLTRLSIIWYLHFLHGFYVYFISNLNVKIKLSEHQTFNFRRSIIRQIEINALFI